MGIFHLFTIFAVRIIGVLDQGIGLRSYPRTWAGNAAKEMSLLIKEVFWAYDMHICTLLPQEGD